LSHLPLWALYYLSDVMFYILYFFITYRKKVVYENLKNSFPDRSLKEIEVISKFFFRHLSDLIFESLKGFSISVGELQQHYRFTNIELLESYYKNDKSVTILGAHYANWEWVALSLPLITKFQTYGIYQTLTDPFMNNVIKKSRERNGMKLISKEEVLTTLENTQSQKITMGYIADQSPSKHGRHYWIKFLNQDTVTMSGFEHFAKKFNTPVVYLNILKKKRGYYEGTFYPVTDEPQKLADGEITEIFMKKLEEIIRKDPPYWLWSHRRWKIKKTH